MPITPSQLASESLYSYSIITATNVQQLLKQISSTDFTKLIQTHDAIIDAVWTAQATFPRNYFDGLYQNQVILMLAWRPGKGIPVTIDYIFDSLDGITALTTRVYDVIYQPDYLQQPFEPGFFVHREELYNKSDEKQVITLSMKAWETYQQAFGLQIVGLFREHTNSPDQSKLLRITRYTNYRGWLESRKFDHDRKSKALFIQREKLQLNGQTKTYATNSFTPQWQNQIT